jgi:UDP-2,3-diacylglucosamine hydrolase
MNPVLTALPHWRTLDFISDLHLQVNEPDTFSVFQRYLAQTQADAVFILGDLFEVWVGDDVLSQSKAQTPGFESLCQQLLKATSKRLSVFFMHGNRDFLLGNRFAQACGMSLLADPTVLVFDSQRWLLSHGDALCLNDTDYQQFRREVRSPAWRAQFLAKPLAERLSIARGLRLQSQARQQSGTPYADVDDAAACNWLQASGANTLIHGHTHQAADHSMSKAPGLRRLVLSDWDACALPPRLQVLRLQVGVPPQRLNLDSGL